MKKYRENGFILVNLIGALALFVLRRSRACCRYIKARYSHIFVDEYQDADQNQHKIFLFLHALNLVAVAVGDASQSIFGFAGKTADFLLSLPRQSGFSQFSILYNHRNHPSISNYANMIISSNPQLLKCDDIRVYEKYCIGDESSISDWIDQYLPRMMNDVHCDALNKVGILTPKNIISEEMGRMLKTPNKVFCTHPLEERQSLTANFLSKLLYFYFDVSITCEEFIDSFFGDCDKHFRIKTRENLRNFRNVKSDDFISKTIKLAEQLANFSLIEDDLEMLKSDSFENLKKFYSPSLENQINITAIP